VHTEQDIALVRTIGWTPTIEPIPLLPDSERSEDGRRVISIGYPTGLAMLAKLDYTEKNQAGNCHHVEMIQDAASPELP
jgi:hypothetical protein